MKEEIVRKEKQDNIKYLVTTTTGKIAKSGTVYKPFKRSMEKINYCKDEVPDRLHYYIGLSTNIYQIP